MNQNNINQWNLAIHQNELANGFESTANSLDDYLTREKEYQDNIEQFERDLIRSIAARNQQINQQGINNNNF